MPTVNHAKLWNSHDENQQNGTIQERSNGFKDNSENNEKTIDNGYKEMFKQKDTKLVKIIEQISNHSSVKNGIDDDIDVRTDISSDTDNKINGAQNIINGKSTAERNERLFKTNNKNGDEINDTRNIINRTSAGKNNEKIFKTIFNNVDEIINGRTTAKYNERFIKTNRIDLKEDDNVNGTDNDRTHQENFIKKPRWRLDSRMLITLLILNVTGEGTAVEVISTNTLASLLGYPSTCTLGSEVRPCTLSLTCWLRGGTRLRGCGGWLFSCCQPPDNSWETFDNNIPSSDWKYKVSPPRLRQVPQRNVMPNNVFRRRVDEDVTQFDCGVPSSRILQKRIIGGREARFAEFPWQAHVRISEFQCGGVLVSRWYVATAAHCVSRAHIRDIAVWLGALDTSAGSHTARKLGVIQKILHPLFQFRMTQPDRYDIALLKLSRPITFTRHIRAICLPESELELRGRSAVIAGWGKTDATDTHTGTNMLRSATVPILSKEQCITWHRIKQISVEIHSEMICAGHSDGHQDACLGDSGGPLIVLDNGRYYLVGITSAGFGCGVDHQPGIYHNVQITANWIRGVTGPTINYIEA